MTISGRGGDRVMKMEGGRSSFFEASRPDDHLGHTVGVAVGRRPPVLEVAASIFADLSGNSDRGSAVGDAYKEFRILLQPKSFPMLAMMKGQAKSSCNFLKLTGREVENAGGLVMTGEAAFVVLAAVRIVGSDVFGVLAGQQLDRALDLRDAALLSHRQRGIIGVSASPVPIARHGLRVEGDDNAEVLCHAVEDESGHPQVISHLYAFARPDLILPLGRHHLGVGACDLDARVKAGAVMSFQDVAPDGSSGADAAVIRTCKGVT